MSVGHSGSSVVAEMMARVGWNIPDSEHARRRGEVASVVDLNNRLMKKEKIERSEMIRVLSKLEAPFLAKDPRFSVTLPKWIKALKKFEEESGRPVALVYLTKDIELIKKSHIRRGQYKTEGGKKVAFSKGMTVEEARDKCESFFESWEGLKIKLSFEDIKHAISIFDVTRDKARHKSHGKSGFLP
jgi:hypothetical protein